MSGSDRANTSGDSGKVWRWLPVILWMALIFTLSGIPLNGHVIRLFRHQDKLIHVFEYGILGLLLARTVFAAGMPVMRYWYCIGASVLVGAVDEFHQSFVPGRMMDWHDLLADAGGALLFVWLWLAMNGGGLFKTAAARAENES
ncbi:MAG: VanZ family protein [Candidatus Glassbacteria bacterium]|nr:VanZ family protein [Candidatus Glassbacteria bacterium]